MTALALARKWRPKNFSELVEQRHVSQALQHALEKNRLHHAYLFTGTRGVGKTTIARILAKSLNCAQGVTAEPCGQCEACLEIDQGKFVDLIEIDAASRTKVEDTRDILDNVQYTPSKGRYKVYLIDEVHMLSNHSFNALLKTLEEPPAHVIFLLATTDPQKLPVTVLSRCLQFYLKKLPLPAITAQLEKILTVEQCQFETQALNLIAQAAKGSLRDALSLTDQAIAFCQENLTYEHVRQMLGNMDHDQLWQLLTALAKEDQTALLAVSADLAAHGQDFEQALDELITLLQYIAIYQIAPDAMAFEHLDKQKIAEFSGIFSRETLQLYYQIALLGRRDLPLSPDPKLGFDMLLLRLMAFMPEAIETPQPKPIRVSKKPPTSPTAPLTEAPPTRIQQCTQPKNHDWAAQVQALKLTGITKTLAENMALVSDSEQEIILALSTDYAAMLNDKQKTRLHEALNQARGRKIKLEIQIADKLPQLTPAEQQAQDTGEQHRQAVKAIEEDPHIKALTDTFDAKVIPEAIKPLDSM